MRRQPSAKEAHNIAKSRKWSPSIATNSNNRSLAHRNGPKRANHRCHRMTRQKKTSLSVDCHLCTGRKGHEAFVREDVCERGDLWSRLFKEILFTWLIYHQVQAKTPPQCICSRFPDPKTTRGRIQHIDKFPTNSHKSDSITLGSIQLA